MAHSDQQPIRVAQFGLGPIGIHTLQLLATKPWAQVVGGIDIDPEKLQRSLAELAGDARLGDARVFATFEQLIRSGKLDVIVHTAGSKVAAAIEQITPIARAGVSVVSSCEELLFPAHRGGDLAAQLNRTCEQSGARVVATGVNPGFVMDVLPICITGVCGDVEAIEVDRVVNASTRRLPLQRKIGSGIAPDEFRARFARGDIGHAGLQESVALLAHAMGWRVDGIEEIGEPIVAQREIRTQHFTVQPGQTCGLHQRGIANVQGKQRIALDLKMLLDAPDPHDAVRILGSAPMNLRIENGTPGEQATVAALVNTIPRLLRTTPGLKLLTDLALPCYC